MKIVKNEMTTLDHKILKFLKEFALGKDNQKSGDFIKHMFVLRNKTQLRNCIKRIRMNQDVLIGSTKKGYWVALENEKEQAVKMMFEKAKSEIETLSHIAPEKLAELHSWIGSLNKKVDKAPQGQFKVLFNGWERPTVNRYGNKYLKGE